jgi:hypothetical protein
MKTWTLGFLVTLSSLAATTEDPNRVPQTREVTEDDGKSWFTEFDRLCIRAP